jgi:hypothetical protein
MAFQYTWKAIFCMKTCQLPEQSADNIAAPPDIGTAVVKLVVDARGWQRRSTGDLAGHAGV